MHLFRHLCTRSPKCAHRVQGLLVQFLDLICFQNSKSPWLISIIVFADDETHHDDTVEPVKGKITTVTSGTNGLS